MKKSTKEDIRMFVGLAVLGGAVLWYLNRRVSEATGGLERGLSNLGDGVRYAWDGLGDATGRAASTVGTGLNPTSDQNWAYRGVNAAGASLTGKPDFDLGGWTYDVAPPGSLLAKAGNAVYAALFPVQGVVRAVSDAWPSTTAAQATQADVRRVDNALDLSDPANPFQNAAGYDFRYF